MRPEFYGFVCELATTGEVPWQWAGQPESAEGFAASLQIGLLCQFVPVSRGNGQPIGVVRALHANFFHGHAYLSFYFAERYRRGPMVPESMVLFVDFLFRRYGFRKLYCEILETDYAAVATGSNRFFEVEARLKGFTIVDGRPTDRLTLTVDAGAWMAVRNELMAYIQPGGQS